MSSVDDLGLAQKFSIRKCSFSRVHIGVKTSYPGVSLPGAIKNSGWILTGTEQHVPELLVE